MLPAIDRPKKYDKNDINLKIIDGMFSTTYTPSTQEMDGNQRNADLDDLFQDMFEQMQSSSTGQCEAAFEDAVQNYAIPESVSVGARVAVKSQIDSAYDLADKLGQDAVQHLEATVSEFNNLCKAKL